MPFVAVVVPSNILQTVTARKVKFNTIEFTSLIANVNLTLVFCGNASKTVCH